MNNKGRLRTAFILMVAMIALLSSCEEPKAEFTGKYRTPTIAGTVSLPDSSGLSLSDIWVKVIDSNGQTKNVSRVASDGSFAVSGLSENEKYDVYFSSEEPDFNNYNDKGIESKAPGESKGFGGWLGQVDAAVNDGNNVGSVKMKPLGTIRGKAMYKGLDEHYDIDVYIPGTSYIAKTAEDGSWSIFNVPQGTHRIRIASTGYIAQMLDNAILIGEDETTNPVLEVNDVTLIKNEGVVKGVAKLSGSSNSSGISIKLEGEKATGKEIAVTSQDGSYSIPSVAPGTYSLLAMHDGFMDRKVEGIVVRASETTIVEDIRLSKETAVVEGTVELAGAKSHEGVAVLLKTSGGERQYSATTDQNGRFMFSEIEPDSYMLLASKDGYVSFATSGIDVDASETKAVSKIVLTEAQRSISGKITLEGKDDHSGISLTATSITETTLVYAALTNSEGYYSFSGMKPGQYIISASSAGYVNATLPTVNVTDSSISSVEEAELKIARGLITGIAKLEGRADSSGIKVELVGTDYSTETDESGIYSFSVPSGNYAGGVRFSHGYYEAASDTETITVMTNGSYGVPKVELKCLYVDVFGKVDVFGTDDDSGVTVGLEGKEYITKYDGSFAFSKVKVGEQKLVFKRLNAPIVTANVSAYASEGIDLGTYMIIPDSASISGVAKLDGKVDHSGIKVTATGSNGAVIATETEASGYFYMSNLLSSAGYDVSFSKEGWDSPESISVSDLQSMEERNITGEGVVLYDTTAPVIESVTINGGANVTSNRIVTLDIKANDVGSGIESMMITWLEDGFEASTWVDYESRFDSAIPETQVLNGEKIVSIKVKDGSGNESEVPASASILLTDQVRAIRGLIEDEELHWVAGAPYVIDGDIIVNSGDTLVIDPGVQVYFLGDYQIVIRGDIEARGTEENPIRMEPAGDNLKTGDSDANVYHGTWKGINVVNGVLDVTFDDFEYIHNSGSILENVVIDNISEGVDGSVFIRDSEITASEGGYALGYARRPMSGILTGNTIEGSVYYYYNTYDNDSNLCDYFIFNNHFYGKEDGTEKYYLDADTENGIVNNLFEGFGELQIRLYSDGFNESCTFVNIDEVYINILSTHCVFSNISQPIALGSASTRYEYCEFHDFYSDVIMSTTSNYKYTHDEMHCYWGEAQTNELENIRNNVVTTNHVSFIEDGRWIGNTDKAVINYKPYMLGPVGGAGYQGGAFSRSRIEMEAPAEANLTISEDYEVQATANVVGRVETSYGAEPVEYRVSRTPVSFSEGIEEAAEWKQIIGGEIEIPLDTAGTIDWYVQLRDSEGNIQPIQKVEVVGIGSGPNGLVFYDCDADNEVGNADGLISTECGWRYLEAAPADLRVVYGVPTVDSSVEGYSSANDDYYFGYYRKSDNGDNLYVNGTTDYNATTCTGEAIGRGMGNTDKLVNAMGDSAYSSSSGSSKTRNYAARLCSILEHNGYDDWFLPSRDELDLMYENLYKIGLGSFTDSWYWSSSEVNDSAYSAWYQHFDTGDQSDDYRGWYNSIRPCRAF